MRWVEVHVATGTVMVRSVAADPGTGAPVYRLELFAGTGHAHGIRVEEFQDRAAWESAIKDARRSTESES